MLNKRGPGDRVIVVAAATRTSGQAVVEQGWHGFCETDAASGARYALDISQTEHEVAFLATATKGALVYLDGSNAMTLTVGTNRPFGKVTAVPGDGITADANVEPKTGKMWILVLPQA